MRRFFLCFLLCLMPLRLWAGAWMPMAQSGSHHQPTQAQTLSVQHTAVEAMDGAMLGAMQSAMVGAVVAHDCHEGPAQSPVASEDAKAPADCHETSCQLCGVCHQSANLALWPWLAPVLSSDSLPVAASHQPTGQVFSPPIKPPIS